MAEPILPISFQERLAECLSEVERHSVKEVGRLYQVVSKLQEENRALRRSIPESAECFDLPVMRLPDTDPADRVLDLTNDGNEGSPKVNFAVKRVFCPTKMCDAATEVGELQEPDSMGHEASILSQGSAVIAPLSEEAQQIMRANRSTGTALSSVGDERSSIASLTVRDIVTKKKSVTSTTWRFYKRVGLAGQAVRSPYFQYGTLALVFLNTLWIAIDLDLNGRPLPESAPVFQVIENLFVLAFLLEMIVRYCAFVNKCDVFLDGWFLFDLLLVLAMVVESWIAPLVLTMTSSADVGGIGKVSALRNVRLVRIARVAGIARFVPELRTMTNSMLAGVRSVAMTVLILLVLTYGVAILLRQLGGSTSWGDQFFSSVPESMYSLLVYTVVPEHAILLNRMRVDSWYCCIIYLSFVLFSVIMLMNMLVAFLCDVIFRESSSEKDRRNLEVMSVKLMAIFQSIGLGESDLLSKSQFMDMITDESAVNILADVGVDVVALADESDYIFSHNERPFMSFDMFKEEVLKFRNSNLATLGSITATRRFVRMGLGELAEKIDAVETTALRLLTEVRNSHPRASRTSRNSGGSKVRQKVAL